MYNMRQKQYYSAQEVTNNLYTAGQEWMTEEFVEYKGLYHTYTTGEVYTESTWRPGISVKLIKYENVSPTTISYKKLNAVNVKFDPIYAVYPVITEADKARKFITRFFIKKLNDSVITEIDELQYNKWVAKKIDPNLYTCIKIQWQIAGELITKRINNVLVTSVESNNRQRVLVAEQSMPGIQDKLTNLLQFYTDTDFIVPRDINS